MIEALGLRDVTFVGNSMGGFIGLRLAARHPDLLRSLVVLGTSADIEEQAEGMDALAAVVAEQGIEPVIDGVLYFMLGDTSLTDPSRADVLVSARATVASRTPEYADAAWHIAHRPAILDELSTHLGPADRDRRDRGPHLPAAEVRADRRARPARHASSSWSAPATSTRWRTRTR